MEAILRMGLKTSDQGDYRMMPLARTPLVSVIIIFFNDERFLSEAIESVIVQSMDDWELLLADDGSSDDSTRIAKEYAARFVDKICYLEHPNHENRGMSASRNLGISNAKGRYLAFLDSDDVWLPQKLEKQVGVLHLKPDVVMTYGPVHVWRRWSADCPQNEKDNIQDLGGRYDIQYKGFSLASAYLRNEGITPCPCSVLARADIVRKVHGFESSFRGMYEDQVFYMKMCLEGSIFVSSECLSKYRRHAGSICSRLYGTKEYHRIRFLFLSWLQTYLREKQSRRLRLWWALKIELLPYAHRELHKRLLILRNIPSSAKNLVKRIILKMVRALQFSS
jgi:glycosyltransferase involved in cell wall biosynthesis